MDCECSEEYGPCEKHGTLLVSREGASLRTADELLLVLCQDLIDLGAEITPRGREVMAEAGAMLDENRAYGVAWFPDGEEGQRVHEDLLYLANQLQSSVSDLWVVEDDGYRIVRPSTDCPLTA